MIRDWTWAGPALWGGIAACVIVLTIGEARSHSWFDPWCCDDRDCAVIPERTVKATADGYVVTLNPGDHPSVNSPVVHVVPYKDVRHSPDGTYAACLYPSQNVMRCFYAPHPGV